MHAARSELCALYLCLQSDADISRENLTAGLSSFWDRTYVRTVFAMFEGVTYSTRQYILAVAADGHFSITTEEINLLSELTYTLDSKGKVKQKENFLQFLPGFLLTFRILGRCLSMDGYVALALGHHGFEKFKESIEIRNHVTHPKKLGEIIISRNELDAVKLAEKWFNSLLMSLLGIAFESQTFSQEHS